jgi:hypothetical protein
VRAEQRSGGGGGGGGGGARRRPELYSPAAASRLHRARSARSRRLLCRRQQRLVPHALDRRTGEPREVNPYPRMFSGEPSSALVERWQWTYPIIFSPADPNVLYTSSQHVWRTTNGGDSWDQISATLTVTIQDRWGLRADRSRTT